MRLPSLSIPIGSSLLPPAGLCTHFGGLNILVGFPVSGVAILLRRNVGRFGGALPLAWLNYFKGTIQAG